MTPEQATAPALPLRPQDEMECRRCGVHCDKVVYPGACLSRGCPFVYSYEAWGHTYVGCMQKVYEVEIDLDMLRAAEERKPGFGAIRAVRRPLPMCRAEVERTYESRADAEAFGLAPLLDTMVFSEEAGATKPSPEIFLRACRELAVEPIDTMFVGDRLETDVQGAAGVGMTTVQALWFTADDTPGIEPDFMAFTPMDVLNAVRRLAR